MKEETEIETIDLLERIIYQNGWLYTKDIHQLKRLLAKTKGGEK